MERGLPAMRPRYRAFGRGHLDRLPQLRSMSEEQRLALEAVSAVLPFKVSSYVIDELIDWHDVPRDPIYQLTFPQVGMIDTQDFLVMRGLVRARASEQEIRLAAREVQRRMNPHPGGQLQLNIPTIGGERLVGCQHKYRETLLFFPAQGQTCHAYCTYCFRWAQLVGLEPMRFAEHQVDLLVRYLKAHTEITDVLLTGGDPLVMSSSVLRRYIQPLLQPGLEHVRSIRIGSKALSYWPYRFTTDADADDLLRLFEEIRAEGRLVALMAHFSHPRELGTRHVERALRRITSTGAVVRCQAPLVRHVNDTADSWVEMWRRQVRLGAVPYYMFVERDTGPKRYFEVKLARAVRLFNEAFARVSGLARTVRGPSMSAAPGKILIDGVIELGPERAFVLKLVQAREPEWVNRIMLARFDSQAVWLDDLEPFDQKGSFFFEPYLRAMHQGRWLPSWQLEADELGGDVQQKVS